MVKEPNSREFYSIQYLAALDGNLQASQDILRDRLKSVPDLYRQFRIATVATDKVVDMLYDTLPTKSILRLKRINQKSEVVIRQRGPLDATTDTTLVLNKNLDILVQSAIANHCSICLKSGKEVKKCKLRDAFLNIIPPPKISEVMCEYSGLESGLNEDI